MTGKVGRLITAVCSPQFHSGSDSNSGDDDGNINVASGVGAAVGLAFVLVAACDSRNRRVHVL